MQSIHRHLGMMMKSRTLFFVAVGLFILGIAIFAFTLRNQEPTQVFAATMNRDCAPWDGSAFRVSVPMDDGTVINISIWQAPDIKYSKTFIFPDDTGQVGNLSLLLANGEYETLSGEVRLEGVSEASHSQADSI